MRQTTTYLTILSITLNSYNVWAQGTQSNANTNENKIERTMQNQNFTTTILVDQTPKEVFDAINNVRGWWSEEIEGCTEKLNDEFNYHYKDVHISKMKLIEVVPNEKVVWRVVNNHFNFTKDKSEWTGTTISFEISKQGKKTKLLFTHLGLVPEYECFDVCSEGWSNYINNSLRSLIMTGKGQPNPKEGGFNAQIIENWKLDEGKEQDYTESITVNATAQQAFESINNVTKWWTENLVGSSQKLNDEFTVRFDDVHVSTQKLVEVIPNKKVVWLVTDSNLNFIEDKHEWTGTKISFEIFEKDKKTQVRFTHLGLVPNIECFNACSNAWSEYLQQSLLSLINTGKGHPTPKAKTKATKVTDGSSL